MSTTKEQQLSREENFINNCLKAFLDDKHRIQEKVITVSKKLLFLVLPCLGLLSLQARTKLNFMIPSK